MKTSQQRNSADRDSSAARMTRLIRLSIAMATCFIVSAGAAWAATLTWNANTEPDLTGYRVYRCSSLPCTRTSANAAVLATLGRVTSVNIGTPSVPQHYVITAFDSANNESSESNLATYTPPAPVPPPPGPDPSPEPPALVPPPAPSNLRLSFGN
jgi:hypothetical protein